MRAEGTFSVASFTPAELIPPPIPIEVGAPVGVATMEKVYAGEVEGHSATIFTSACDMGTGVGTYVAMESFEGSLAGRRGGFAFVHSATTTGEDRSRELSQLNLSVPKFQFVRDQQTMWKPAMEHIASQAK